ncbi:tolloid-like protein 1 [Dreissena polymorpha]|uniref:Metalloendopeptidase n=1 Tax=Dreissena polymorpha TaxID=45954 RepID=A0A9D4N163_DREPO|nr:tolloid-like protein 1 [Dreissena polymorpha]KAH3884817.1 hypothetical protein DPMN_008802 [Dreissena polymorpha]
MPRRETWTIMCLVGIIMKGCWAAQLTTERPDDEDREGSHLWPDAVIPYNISDGAYDARQLGLILAAMKRWEYKTCVRFEPWSYRRFGNTAVNLNSAGRCFSRVGKDARQPQSLGIGNGCFAMSVVVHELGHTIGRLHEMERDDRDLYIRVLFENINPASIRNFLTARMKNGSYETYGTPYDYKSIMHYGDHIYSANGKHTMLTRDPAYQHVIGQGDDVSFFDAMYVNKAYSCSERCPASLRSVCRNGGFLGGSDCRCLCPDGYSGQFCEILLPGITQVIDWRCPGEWVYYQGRCFLFYTQSVMSFARADATCTINGAALVTVKDRADMSWLRFRLEETRLVTGAGRFWVGAKREAGAAAIRWTDGSLVDTNLVSVRDMCRPDVCGCGQFDGETLTLTNCSSALPVVCEKMYDRPCGGRYMASRVGEYIESPGFPNFYPSDASCTYTIQAPEGSAIRLQFDSQSLLEINCDKDFVEIFLSNATTDPVRYCGSTLAGISLVSTDNLVIIRFKSDGRLTYRGFRALFTEVPGDTAYGSPYFLEALQRSLRPMNGREQAGESMWNLSAVYKTIKDLVFSKVL